MKPYPSTLKEKRRYCVFEIVSEKKFSKSEAQRMLWNTVFDLIGKLGAAESAFWLIEFDERTQKGIFRATNEGLDRVRACLALIPFKAEDKVNKAFIHIISVTGTIKKAKSLMTKKNKGVKKKE